MTEPPAAAASGSEAFDPEEAVAGPVRGRFPSRPHALAGERVGVLGAACSLCGGRAESQVVVRAGATLNVHPGTRLEARCRACGLVDAYEPASLMVWW